MSRGHGVLPISGIPRARDMLPLAKAGSSFTLFVRIWTLLRNAGVIQIFVMLAEDKKAGPQKSGFRRVAVSSLYNQFIAARPYSDKIAIQPHFCPATGQDTDASFPMFTSARCVFALRSHNSDLSKSQSLARLNRTVPYDSGFG